MPEKKFMYLCPLCDCEYQMGPHRYEGRKCKGYEMFVCRGCFHANEEGWATTFEETILNLLEEKGIEPPKRNKDGYLPREF